jgi:hypothetical protein
LPRGRTGSTPRWILSLEGNATSRVNNGLSLVWVAHPVATCWPFSASKLAIVVPKFAATLRMGLISHNASLVAVEFRWRAVYGAQRARPLSRCPSPTAKKRDPSVTMQVLNCIRASSRVNTFLCYFAPAYCSLPALGSSRRPVSIKLYAARNPSGALRA